MDFAKNLKLIIFDFDGTLHDPGIDWESVKQAIGIEGTSESLGDAINRFKIEKNHTALQTITELELNAIKGQKINSSVIKVLKNLQEKYELAVFSRNSRKMIERLFKRSGLSSIYLVGREDVERIKPHPSGLYKILAQFDRLPNHAVLVGDTFHDAVVAQLVGLTSVIVGENYKPEAKTSKQPDYHMKSLEEFASMMGVGA